VIDLTNIQFERTALADGSIRYHGLYGVNIRLDVTPQVLAESKLTPEQLEKELKQQIAAAIWRHAYAELMSDLRPLLKICQAELPPHTLGLGFLRSIFMNLNPNFAETKYQPIVESKKLLNNEDPHKS
jgi:hypothetical protein